MAEMLEEILDLPPGLERSTLRIIQQRKGRGMAITKAELLSLLAQHGYKGAHIDRKVRHAIHSLRRQGALICSSSSGKGFWWAANRDEADTFISEMKSRGSDILQTARALEKAVEEKYEQQTVRMF